ncbi:MAG: methylated-DNA--[protein]-cysteine S-methyltransferase [Proteobacteria bacterium]|nr:methylated-DNA--[protein]-cysteine S-methyltransferase [Pseudomonadota bacterium]
MAIRVKTKRHTFLVDSPVGRLGVTTHEGRLQSIDFLTASAALAPPVEPFDKEVAKQLQAYFQNPDFTFSLPLCDAASDFQQRLRKQLLKVKPGKPETYGSMAQYLNSAPRAVGAALRANPVPLVVPCHRVIAATDIGGFSGKRSGRLPAIKQWLLNYEQG